MPLVSPAVDARGARPDARARSGPASGPAPRPLAAAVALTLVIAACGSTAPTPLPGTPSPITSATPSSASTPAPASPSASTGTGDDVYAQIAAAVRDIRGLREESPVRPEVIDEAELGTFVRSEFERENPPEYVAAWERLLRHLALVPADADIKELYLELLESQVLGLYDPADNRMLVVTRTGDVSTLDEVTYAHEYAHALADQAFDLEKVQDVELDEGDRAIARLAFVEGDATLVMTLWAQQNLTPDQLLEFAQGSADEEQNAVLERMPAILRETLLFPYTAGLNYVIALHTTGGWQAVDAEYADPPASTEQILHPDRRSQAPVAVSFPRDLASGMGRGWSEVLQDTLGEFQLGIWLREAGLGAVSSGSVADGWGGDRVILLEGPNDAWATVVDIAWDTRADADEFRDASGDLVAMLEQAGGQADVLSLGPTSTTVVVGSDVDAMARVANLLGLAG